ncbi:hypothetical protein [Actinoplanes sp. G11-F43]|uniref:hypothetical protein n=1 Tax=Actinoplanes sp. G11-F43 TaxID=3424130 RepID=UPI003D341359
MNSARLAVAGAALMAVTALGACGSGDDTTPAAGTTGAAAPATTAAEPEDARGRLIAAAEKTTSTTAKVKNSSGTISMTGQIDVPNQLVELTSDFGSAGRIDTRRVGNDLYFKATGKIAASYSGNGKKWLHIDGSTRPAGSSLSLDQNDPAGSAKLLTVATADVEEAGAGEFKGTLDLTKSPAIGLVPEAAKAKYSAVPFVAEVADGYLTKVTMDMSTVVKGAGDAVTAFSAFGEPAAITAPPAAQVIEMSDADIKKMGG